MAGSARSFISKRCRRNLIEQSGLVSVNEEKERVFDRFRGRIMFPVLDVNGDPVAFGARAMGDDQPKYLNSPETPAYVKGKHLYGLFQSKEAIRQKKFAILVEGYLDLIALYQFGVTNVAASLGTAFTPDQSKLLPAFLEGRYQLRRRSGRRKGGSACDRGTAAAGFRHQGSRVARWPRPGRFHSCKRL